MHKPLLSFILITLSSLFLGQLAQADLYKLVDENGNITYTDMPPSMEAKPYKLGRISSVGNPVFNMEKLNMVIPYEDKDGAMVVQGAVNGVAMSFVVDTGATLLAIPPAIAEKAGLHLLPSKKITAQTANGAIQVSRVSLSKVTVAKVSQDNVDATIQSVSTINPNLGLLGMSFFNKYKMTIDHEKKQIQLEKKK